MKYQTFIKSCSKDKEILHFEFVFVFIYIFMRTEPELVGAAYMTPRKFFFGKISKLNRNPPPLRKNSWLLENFKDNGDQYLKLSIPKTWNNESEGFINIKK